MSTNRIFKSGSLKRFSPDAENWLTSCLDPFHDYQYEVEGLPDEKVAPSVVQVHNQKYTLTAPTSAGAGNWDASVLYTGLNTPIEWPTDSSGGGWLAVASSPGSGLHTYSSAGLNAGIPMGALQVWAGASGASMEIGAPGTVGETAVALGSVSKTDRCRLIGVGIEIHNTTAAVYKQGSLTVAMLPDVAVDTGMVRYRDSTASLSDQFQQCDRGVVAATTLKPLLAVPGSSTWAAEDGCYLIPRMTTLPRDVDFFGYSTSPVGANHRVPVMYGTDGAVATPEPSAYYSSGGSQALFFQPATSSGFSPAQVFLTGLSSASTITISFRTIVEYFPSLNSPLLPLSTPSPVYDPKALAFYSAVAARAPYAVTVDQNGLGDYFKKVLKVMSECLPVIAPIFGEFAPLASGVGIAAGVGSRLLEREAGPQNAQGRKTVPPPPPRTRVVKRAK